MPEDQESTIRHQRAEFRVLISVMFLLFGYGVHCFMYTLIVTEDNLPGMIVDDPYLVQINEDESATIQLLPDIGPSLAGRIIEHRKEYGAFQQSSDLERIKGIGPKKASGINPYITY